MLRNVEENLKRFDITKEQLIEKNKEEMTDFLDGMFDTFRDDLTIAIISDHFPYITSEEIIKNKDVIDTLTNKAITLFSGKRW